ncbi:MAG: ATP-dependent helicase HrpB [Thiolinea sp.]
MPDALPVESILDTLRQQLSQHHEVVLEAPPGAGKTTMVPLALMHEAWLADKKILMLEPRRIAARSAAHRLAQLLNEAPGQTVGYRMRLDTKVSQQTRIEVITEGILTRMLQNDPALEEVGLVIFDEFHERSLDSDLALALCLKGRSLFRDQESGEPALKILLMSATLNSEALSGLLDGAPVVKSEGRSWPIDIVYGRPSQPRERISERMAATIQQALSDNPHSSILAFLPGQGEIRQTADALAVWMTERKIRGVHIHPLYGHLSLAEQQQAIAPLSGAQADDQKVVLATNIAETSLTIEGIDVVVDSSLMRESRFNPSTGMSGLQLVKISQASAIQRAGRAGRLRPGKCYRLWSESQQSQLEPYNTPEILQADLAPLALQLLQWGEDDPQELCWSDPPPAGAWQQALDLLDRLGAIESKGSQHTKTLNAHGQAMAAIGTHPRLAHLLVCGATIGFSGLASQLAALLSERDPFRDQPDISYRLSLLSGDKPCPKAHQGWLARTRQLAAQYHEQLKKAGSSAPHSVTSMLSTEQATGYLLACAYPDRIARRRHSGTYQLSNGRSAGFYDKHPLGNSPWLAVAEVSSSAGKQGDTIRSAAQLDEGLFSHLLSDALTLETVIEWDKQAGRFIAEEQEKIGALTLQRTRLDRVPVEEKRAALLNYIRKEGLSLLPWKEEHKQWCARVLLLRNVDETGNWPDVSEAGLLNSMEDWLAPYIDHISTLQDFRKLDLQTILQSALSWEQQQRLQQLAPLRLKVPSGSSVAIDYTNSPPVLAVKLQEMFGCEQTPTVAEGKVSLLVHLLSPAGRPLQITRDLAGFWRSSYHAVKKDMKGRYPKHPWPDDPLQALATAKTKAWLSKQQHQ